ncbi:MAG: LTA synthase family protein [Cytophagales bacterium]|nr:LTA synthase family protein [Cytophagales bacterium]
MTAFRKGVYMDVSMACYFLALPLVLLFVQSFLKKNRVTSRISKYFTYLLVLLNSALVSGEMPLFPEWNSKLNYKVLLYLEQPGEVMRITPFSTIAAVIFMVALQFALGVWLYKRMMKSQRQVQTPWYSGTAVFLLLLTFDVLGIRGGWQEMPIRQSDVYFSQSNRVNLLAVNSTWNFIRSWMKNKKNLKGNPYKYFQKEEAESIANSLHPEFKADSTVSVLKTRRPNIVLLVLESFGGDVVERLGGYKGITPNFDRLSREGLFFENVYTSAERSDQGMTGIFSGFPAQQFTSVGAQTAKAPNLPSMLRILRSAGYQTSFHFGGQLNFGNIKSYLYSQGMETVVDEEDFPSRQKTSRLGAHDEYLFARLLKDQKPLREPFLSAAFTQSSHSPYDHPAAGHFTQFGIHNGYMSGVWYMDSCLNEYLNKAKAEEWYDNTLFVLVADHGHSSPRNWEQDAPDSRRVPLLLWGPALKEEYRGKEVSSVAEQNDIPATLLAQLQLPAEEFEWSKNMLDPQTRGFAYYCSKRGMGWIDDKGKHMVYSTEKDTIYNTSYLDAFEAEEALKKAKAYTQVVFDRYLAY